MADNPVTRLYHRGNNDITQDNYLTAVIQLQLAVDTSACLHNERGCAGEATPKLSVLIESPNGVGNGDVDAGPAAAMFGLKLGANFTPFAGGALTPNNEHWRVEADVELDKIPCDGGVLFSMVEVYLPTPNGYTAYYIYCKVAIASHAINGSCGEVIVNEILLLEGLPWRGLDEGGRIIGTLTQVQPGEAAPYPTKDGTPGDQLHIDANGQPQPAP